MFEDADPPSSIDPTDHSGWFRRGFFGDLHLTVDHLEDLVPSQLEAADGRDITDPLMLTHLVVVIHPDVETVLSLLDGVETGDGEELFAQCLVKPFDLAGGSRRIRAVRR
jgi:hypothetical protein